MPYSFPAIYLASTSPRRAQLLEQIGVPFEIIRPDDPETAELLEAELPNEPALDYVRRVCRAKAFASHAQISAHQLPTRPILCADTTVALNDRIFGKPADAADVHTMLHQLSGKTHQTHTAIAVMHDGQLIERVVTSDVTFRPLTTEDIDVYIASGEPFGKAGAYAIQGLSACFISHLSGSFSAVMGLPLFEVADILQNLHAPTP